MSILEQVEHFVANEGDGVIKALKHLAGEVESLGKGAPPDFAAFKEEIRNKIDGYLGAIGKGVADAREEIGEKFAAMQAEIEGLKVAQHAPVAPPAEPPAASDPAAPQAAAADPSAQPGQGQAQQAS